MKKLFGHSKQKNSKGSNQALAQEEGHIPTPIHQKHAVYLQQLQLQQQLQQLQPNQAAPPPPRSVRRTSSEEERWEVVSGNDDAQQRGQYHSASDPSRTSSFASLPPGASAPISSNNNNPRSPSPFSISTTSSAPTTAKLTYSPPQPQITPQPAAMQRKKPPTSAPVALGILRALDPPRTELLQQQPQHSSRTTSEERFGGGQHTSHSDVSHRERDRGDPLEKKEKRGFWNRDKEKEKDRDRDKEREREREKEKERSHAHVRDKDRGREHSKRDEGQAELTRMIGYLTATASEDWGLVLEVCERASANESNAKEAVRALRREFKYGEPAAQLSAARLWAIMLRNSSELFISQSTARKFLDTLEDLLNSSKTSPVVRERVLDVIAAAAYASGSKRDTGFRGLWRRVKPVDKPDEGMPLNNDDAMFNPPVSGRLSHYDIPIVSYQEPSPLPPDFVQPIPPPHHHTPRKRKSLTRNRIIPPDEDIRRLFQECKIGQGNASLLSEALVHTKPEDLKKKEVVKEFYLKCRTSQELIFAQIPWASAGAEHSRMLKDKERLLHPMDDAAAPVELTTEENLLAALLAANAELIDALQQYDDLERVAMERLAEDISRKETRMDRRQIQQLEQESALGSLIGGTSSPNGSRSPSPMPPTQHPHLHSHSGGLGLEASSLAPPPPAPHGPRLPGPPHPPRTPSPGTPLDGGGFDFQNGMRLRSVGGGDSVSRYDDESDSRTPVKPSAKALGKRKVVDESLPEQHFGEDDLYSSDKDASYSVDDRAASSDSDSDLDAWRRLHRPQTQFVYDAAAERTRQRLREGEAALVLVNGVH